MILLTIKLGYSNNLKQILLTVNTEKLTYPLIVDLVKISRIIVISFLKSRKHSSLQFAYKNGYDINDLAIDLLGELFEKGADDKLYKLNSFISSLRLPLEDIPSSELFHAYYSFLVRLANIQLARIYSSYDPNGQRIKKNIREAAIESKIFEIYKSNYDTIYFIKNHTDNRKLSYLCYEEFEKQFLSLTNGKKTTKELLEIIHTLLINQENCRKEIKLNDIVALLKNYYGYKEESVSGESEEYFFSDNSADIFINKIEIEQIRDKVILKIKEKILVDYFAKGKLNRQQAIGLVKALENIISNWIETGEDNYSYYEHLSGFIDLDKEEYKLSFKAKLEYLIKEAKKQIAIYFNTR